MKNKQINLETSSDPNW